MWNTEHHYHTTQEHRAPTDASVRLLREMEQAAQKKLEATFRLDSNSLKALIHRQDDILNGHRIYFVRYELNGVRSTVEARVDMDWGGKVVTRDQIVEQILKAISDDIAKNALSSAFKELSKMELELCLK